MMLVVRRAQVRLLRIVLKLGRTASEILSKWFPNIDYREWPSNTYQIENHCAVYIGTAKEEKGQCEYSQQIQEMQHLAFSSSIKFSEELFSDVKTNIRYYGVRYNNIFSPYYVGALNLLPTLALKSSNISLYTARSSSLSGPLIKPLSLCRSLSERTNIFDGHDKLWCSGHQWLLGRLSGGSVNSCLTLWLLHYSYLHPSNEFDHNNKPKFDKLDKSLRARSK